MPQAAALPGVSRFPDILDHLTRLNLVTDLSPARWIVESLTDFAKSVNSLVPRGFEGYVRVFHPAQLNGRSVSWAEIAAANGKEPHAGMQLNALTGLDDRDVQPGVFDCSPEEGDLPTDLRRPIVDVLGGHTATADRCWFAYWYGWGGFQPQWGNPPTFATPGREYMLFAGSVDAALDEPYDFRSQSPSIWWPDDHAWCVATEIDLRTTYIGCSNACRVELLARPELEAYEIDPSIGIDWQSDRTNLDAK